MMRAKFVLLPLLCALPLAAQGDQDVPAWIRFEVFNACRAMSVVASLRGDEATIAAFGLTEEDLKTAGKSRVQSARLYVDSIFAVLDGEVDLRKKHTIVDLQNNGILSVDVHVTPSAERISVSYSKRLTDEFQNVRYAKTWDASEPSWHIGGGMLSMEAKRVQGKRIMENVSRLLDMFLYLYANEEACESR